MQLQSNSSKKDFSHFDMQLIGLPLKGLISANEMLPHLPIKRSTLWKWTREGRFPTPVKVSTLTRWHCHEVHDWLKQFEKSATPEQGGRYVS